MVTDGDLRVLPLLRANLSVNADDAAGLTPEAQWLRWGTAPLAESGLAGKWDVVIASDAVRQRP